MNADWMSLFLAALIGFSLAWAICSLWTVRWIDRERRRVHELRAALEQSEATQDELKRLRLQERFNRERA